MKKAVKIILWSALALAILLFGLGTLFMYKVKNGFPASYETTIPSIDFPPGQPAVLLFSKTTGYRHEGSIAASKPAIAELAKKNNWFLYETEEGGVFNAEQLAKFGTVIFNNSTGRVLNEEQKSAFEQYIEAGGSFVGIHGSGDYSHPWEWYTKQLIGVEFSHHPLNPQMQKAEVLMEAGADSLLRAQVPAVWEHEEEWYVFFENPRQHGCEVVCTINGEKILPSGNLSFLVKDKDFGMGKDHPVAWQRQVGKGKAFYVSLGHDAAAWQNAHFLQLLENAIRWSQRKEN